MAKRKEPAIDYVSLANFRYEVRRFLHFAEQAARAAGIEPQQYQALLAIRGLPAWACATVGTLAERLQIRHHSAVELSGRLERPGWIKRVRGSVDRREVLLRLTARGEKLLASLSRLHHRELSTTSPRLIESLRAVVAQDGKSQTETGSGAAPQKGRSKRPSREKSRRAIS